MELAKIEVAIPLLVVRNPINCGVDVEDVDTALLRIPVKLDPSPK